jgi:putative ABC transport system permease protein
VLGARLIDILVIFSKEFTVLAIIAFAIAVPLAWWISNNWLNNFAYRIKIGACIFLATIGCTIIIAWLTVAYESIKAALKNSVESLRANQ